MTTTTMLAVVAELKKRGVPADYEYPGYISVALAHGEFIAYGDANGEEFAGQVHDGEGECTETLDGMNCPDDLLTPLTATQIARIADHITCDYTAGMEVACNCGGGTGQA